MRNTFHKALFLICLLGGATCGEAAAQDKSSAGDGNPQGVKVSDVRIGRHGSYMVVDMNMDLSGLDVETNRAVLLTPQLINGADTSDLHSVGIYGYRRWYHYLRNNGEDMLSGKDEISYRSTKAPDTLSYHAIVPFEEWMNGMKVELSRNDYGCCSTILDKQRDPVGSWNEAFFPPLLFVNPAAEKRKTRNLEGSAYIDFPVDQTVIYPEYRRNMTELGKIRATIDSVRNDSDVIINSVWLKGFASPESPYTHNTELAIGRTAAVKNYIQMLYSFDSGIIATEFEPEDWDGLRRYVESSSLTHRKEILDLIDSDRDPDTKEWLIKSTYKDEYKFLLENCYPALRHTDYRVTYTIRSYSDTREILEIMHTSPQKLSLNEFYLAAQEFEPGTDEFSEVFETAVRMYPDDEIANLNAANAAMRRGDYHSAEHYLDKAGDSPEAVYARGVYAARQDDLKAAVRYMTKADGMGLEQAGEILEELKARNSID